MRLSLLATALLISGYTHAQSSTSYQFERPAGSAEASLRVLTPQGTLYQQQFAAGQSVVLNARLPNGTLLGEGTHRWEVSFAPTVTSAARTQALSARQIGDEQRQAGWPDALPLRSGLFFIKGGQFQPLLQSDSDRDDPAADVESALAVVGGKSAITPKDQLIADDFIVQGSICAGFDCINNENFGANTLVLKENNLRIRFDDTSATGAFPSRDWQLTANDQANGGLSKFSLEDITGSLVPFTVAAGAANNSLYIDADGQVGFGTSTPLRDLHLVVSDSPTLRLEQSNAGGFSAQTWDMAGNESNFFIRDVSNGSRLPLRIRPGAPTSSLDISADGDIGMGIDNPAATVHVRRSADPFGPWLLIERTEDSDPNTEDRRLELDKDGNLFVSGSITQLSSRSSKTGFIALAGHDVLQRLSSLPVWTWNYQNADSSDRHIGPVAEDFYAAFGFGRSERSLAPSDVAGVALAATKALQEKVDQRDQRISELESRLARLEAALEKVEERSQSSH